MSREAPISGEAITDSSGKVGLTSLDGDRRAVLTGKQTQQNLEVQCHQLHWGLLICPHSNRQGYFFCLPKHTLNFTLESSCLIFIAF